MKILNSKQVANLEIENARILAVDDEERQLLSVQNLLLSKGLQVETALGGINGIKTLEQNSFDLVLLDLNMPEMDGHAVMDEMARLHIDTAVIVVSGESTFSAVSKALRRGAYDYIRKPYDPDELMNTVSNCLQQVMLEQAHQSMQTRLQKSEELHRYIVNSSPDVVFMLDKQGRFTFLNKKVETLLGYTRQELIGQNYEAIVESEDRDRASYIFTEQGNKREGAWSSELRLCVKKEEHSARHFELTFFPIERKIKQNGHESMQVVGTYGTARDITERKEAEEFINFQAYHDLLTRLPNRSLFKDRLNISLAQARRYDHKVAVMFLDLDRFKVVNDSLGHAMGDRLLQQVALRLESVIRKCDTLSRFGGDEFTLLLPNISCADDARTIAKKVISILKEPFHLGEHEAFVGVSVGISMFPEAGENVDQLIQNADVAMYHVKSRGKDGYQFFSDAMNVVDTNRLSLERDIRNALENNEFKVFYQLQVSAESNNVIGVEALVRWDHPTRGLVYPAEFLPLAEETRLITDISNWVFETACREVKTWIETDHPDIRLSVNFSPLQVEHPRFVERVLTTLRDAEFPANNLEIELTENVIMNDLQQMTKKLHLLAEHGIRIAIDDFGTGYSSLNYLHKLPIHTLKVDQSFVKDIETTHDDACIVDAIVSMAHGLKLNIIAEGVENQAQLDYLRSLGCQEIQGFFFGRAQPGYEVRNRLDRQRPILQSQAAS
jgi:diguanylate cyclase (GGDEF)-like protein/PAS domain S-box-containing protein